MKNEEIEIIKADVSHLGDVLEIEEKAWGDLDGENMSAQEEAFKFRLENGLCSLAIKGEIPIGVITAYSPSWLKNVDFNYLNKISGSNNNTWREVSSKANLPYDWHEATNNGSLLNNDPNIENFLFLVGVGVDPKYRGNKIVDKLIANVISNNCGKEIIGYGRLPQLLEKFETQPSEDQVNDYLKSKREDGLPKDYGERFHVRNGANAICPIPNAMRGDSECYDYGFLAHYPKKENGD